MEPSSRYLTKVEFVDWLSGFSKWLKEFEEGMVTRLEERLVARLEERLVTRIEEQLAPRFAQIDSRFVAIEDKLDGIDKRLRDIEGFQKYEADAIEYELDMVLQDYLRKTYPLMTIQQFPIKYISDENGVPITELDAAFRMTPYARPDDRELRTLTKGDTLSMRPDKIDAHGLAPQPTFVLAEAKHHITKDKIVTKLVQFDRIMHMFKVVQEIQEKRAKKEVVHGYDTLVRTVDRNKYLIGIERGLLFFGAAYWERGLLKEFQAAVANMKNAVAFFERPLVLDGEDSARQRQKLKAYQTICAIEREWYPADSLPPREVDDAAILRLPTIERYALQCADCIAPSGNRYQVLSTAQSIPIGITHIPLSGGGSVRRGRTEKRRHILKPHTRAQSK
jgi:hypothetical protein